MSNLSIKAPASLKFLIALTALVFLAFLGWRFFLYEPEKIPEQFLEARREGALISQAIVDLVGVSNDRLELIAELEKRGDYAEALNLVVKDFETNKEARERAFELSQRLQKMTEKILEISPAAARLKAQEAVSYELSLISGLISYNQLLGQLLEVLRQELQNGSPAESQKVNELVGQINEEIKNINDLNRRFRKAMEEFDSPRT